MSTGVFDQPSLGTPKEINTALTCKIVLQQLDYSTEHAVSPIGKDRTFLDLGRYLLLTLSHTQTVGNTQNPKELIR